MAQYWDAISNSQIRAFVATVRTGGFTAASQVLHTSQPAVTQNVNKLEQVLNHRLLERSERPIRLTAAGAEVFRLLSQVCDKIDEIPDALAKLSSATDSCIRIHASHVVGTYLLSSVVASFKAKNPLSRVRVELGPMEKMWHLLAKGLIDLGLAGDLTLPSDNRFHYRTLRRVGLVLVGPAGCGLGRGGSLRMNRLRLFELVLPRADSPERQCLETEMMLCGADLSKSVEMGSVESAKQAVLGGLGFAVLPMVAVCKDAQMQKFEFAHIIKASDPSEYLTYEIKAVYPKAHTNPILSTFVSELGAGLETTNECRYRDAPWCVASNE